MSSFSRRRYAVTEFSQVFERLPEAMGAPEDAADEAPAAALDPPSPPGGHGLVEDVDFDTAIAEVLMTLAADRDALQDAGPTDPRETSAAGAERPPLEGAARFHDASGDDDDTEQGDGDALDPEAQLAAEAATFRLLSELDRLWHRTA